MIDHPLKGPLRPGYRSALAEMAGHQVPMRSREFWWQLLIGVLLTYGGLWIALWRPPTWNEMCGAGLYILGFLWMDE